MSSSKQLLHVAVGVVRQAGKVLLAQRHPNAHQGGLWEFPGGKVEAGETLEQALWRELQEELAIVPRHSQPLIQIRHHYPDRSVLLDVWEVLDYEGEPQGNEGQPIVWVESHELGGNEFPLPAANAAIVKALKLPHELLITGDFHNSQDFLKRLYGALERGIRLVQLRSVDNFNDMTPQAGLALAREALALCRRFNAELVLNGRLGLSLDGAGLHLSAAMAREFSERPKVQGLVGISCHNQEELIQAERLQADYVVLSPVAPTKSHPEAEALGWDSFEELVSTVNCPVFALGGMTGGDVEEARRRGGQGIAAISAFWGNPVGGGAAD